MGGTPISPLVLVVDGDRSALEALTADLARRFGGQCTSAGANSTSAALVALRDAAAAREPVAMLIAGSNDADLLVRGHELHPQAKRVLVVNRDYSARSPAVQAIALGQ